MLVRLVCPDGQVRYPLCPEYKDKAKITVLSGERNGATVPTGIPTKNEKGDHKNDYRFMNAEIINEKLKTVKSKKVLSGTLRLARGKCPKIQLPGNSKHRTQFIRCKN